MIRVMMMGVETSISRVEAEKTIQETGFGGEFSPLTMSDKTPMLLSTLLDILRHAI